MIDLQIGEVPWCPSRASTVANIFHIWDIPLTGVIQQADGVRVLFDCIDGETHYTSFWVFTEISPEDEEAFSGKSENEYLDQLERTLAGRSCFVARVGEGSTIEHITGPFSYTSADEMVLKFNDSLKEVRRTSQSLPATDE